MTVGSVVDTVPELIQRIYTRKGAEGTALRSLRNNVAFVVADEQRKGEMRRRTERLTRFASGAAYVSATAEGKRG